MLEGGARSGRFDSPASADLRSPETRLRAGGSKDGTAAQAPAAAAPGRPAKQLRPRPAGRLNFDKSGSDSDEPESDPEPDSEEVDGGAGSGGSDDKEGGGAAHEGGGRPHARQSRRVSFVKRKAKRKGRGKVSKELMEGDSSGSDEDYFSDEELEEEGGSEPLEQEEGEAGPSGEMQWEPVEEGDTVEELQPPPFTGPERRVKGIVHLAALTPLQVFLLLVPLPWWQYVCEQINKYAESSRAGAGLPDGKGRRWTPMTVEEILRWFGLVFAMALHPLPNLSRYWNTGVHGAVKFPGFKAFMPQYSFEQIKRYFHTNDNSQRPPDKGSRMHRLWHLIPLLNTLQETFKAYYPGQL